MSEDLAPIAVFAFRRPRHLQRAIESLLTNDLASGSSLYVFCDAVRHESDVDGVNKVRDYLDALRGFATIKVVHREENLGLARSIISGVTAVLERHSSVIVLEDDLVTSPYFLRYMNTALSIYRDEERVASIHGYVYPVDDPLPESFFLRGADCWGWATWPRAWQKFNPNAQQLVEQLERAGLTHRFDMDGSYDFTEMLRDHVAGRNDSWAVRWHASAFLHNMLTLYPGRSLVENIGFDSSGTHCGTSGDFGGVVSANKVNLIKVPVEEHESARLNVISFFRKLNAPDAVNVSSPSPTHGIKGWIKLCLRRLLGEPKNP